MGRKQVKRTADFYPKFTMHSLHSFCIIFATLKFCFDNIFIAKNATMLKTNTTDRIYRLQIFDNLIVDEKYGMPIVKKYNGELPIKLQAFNKAVTQK